MKNNSNKPVKDNSVIKIGIDLGTTNSEIAINVNGNVEIVKNAQQDEYTPSVFGVDKAGNKVVGRKAYDKLYKSSSEEEFENNKAEVKRLMGTSELVHFTRLKKDLTPEEISAEILISLKEDVARKYPDVSTLAAVITIPAYFSSLQAEATKRAGILAGFRHVILLQEPIAAAMSYGFDNTADENWLVYDLGGGTFDVALISSKDGVLTVLGHSGDNFLGGKDFDWKIVDEFLKPAILEKYNYTDFERSNDKYKSVFAKLKAIAETAKIELSQYENITVEIEDIGEDESGDSVYLSLDISRDFFEKLINPLVQKTIDLAKRTLKDSGLQSTSVSKIVLVGGPTQIPYVRQCLEQAFSLKIDNSIDPLTVVARGACIFGLSKQIPQEILLEGRETDSEEKHATLHYDSITSDEEQTVAGIIEELRESGLDYYIQIQSDSGTYTSAKLKLRNGKFFETVEVEKGKSNTYWLYLFDDSGNPVPLFPDSFSISHGLTVSGSPIPHDIGVFYAKKSIGSDFQTTEICDPYFKKSSIPPLKKTNTYKTIRKLEKGKDDYLPIKVYEGESANPLNNEIITRLKLDGKKLPYDLPSDTDIEITISVDESRSVSVEAYIPSIELTLNARADEYAQEIDIAELENELALQRDRLKSVENDVSPTEYSKLENAVENVATNVKNSKLDTDDKNKAERDLKELKAELDNIEQNKSVPQLKTDYYEKLKNAQEIVDGLDEGKEKDRFIEQLSDLEKEGEKAVKDEDKLMLVRINEQIEQVAMQSVFLNPAAWVYMLNQIKEKRSELLNATDADYFISKADEAVENGDIEELKRCVRNLLDLLPKNTQEEISASTSGITK